MPTSVRSKGLPAPRAHELLLLVGLCALGWWGWNEFGLRRVRQRLWNPDASVVERDHAIEAYAAQGARSVPELVRGLVGDNVRIRSDSARALGKIGAAAVSAVPALKIVCNDPDPTVRRNALRAVVQIVPEDPELVELLVNVAMTDDDSAVRETALATVGTLGSSVLPSLLSLLGDLPSPLRREGIQIAHRIDRDAPEFIAALWRLEDDPDPAVRSDVLVLLMKDRRAPLERVLSWLHESDPSVAQQALEWLSQFESDAAIILPDLCCFLESSEPSEIAGVDLKARALELVTRYGAKSRPAIPALVRLLNRSNDFPWRVHRILTTLAEIGTDQQTLIDILVPLLGEIELSRTAGQILAQVAEEEARRQARLLVERLRSTNKATRNSALNALVGMHAVVPTTPELAALVPELISLLNDRSAPIASQAASILGALGPNAADAVPTIIAMLDRKETLAPGLPTDLIVALGSIGPAAAPAASRLVRFTADSRNEPWKWKSAVIALTQIGVRSPEFLANLVSALEASSPTAEIQGTALESLAALRVADEKLLPRLRSSLEHRLPSVRATAAWSVVDIAGNGPEVVAALTGRLVDPSPTVRMVAATALGKLGPAGASARRALESAASAKENDNPAPLTSYPPSWTGLPGSHLPTQSLPQAIARAIGQIDWNADRSLNPE